MREKDRDKAADVARRELIGMPVRVASPDRGLDGLEGRIVDETKHTFLVEAPSGAEKRVPKRGNRFSFRVGTDAVIVNGDDITFQPEDRIKKVRG